MARKVQSRLEIGEWNCLSRNRNEWEGGRKVEIDRPTGPVGQCHGGTHSTFFFFSLSIQHSAFSIQLYSFSAVEWSWPRMAQSTSCRGALKCAWMPCSSSLLVTWTRTGA